MKLTKAIAAAAVFVCGIQKAWKHFSILVLDIVRL